MTKDHFQSKLLAKQIESKNVFDRIALLLRAEFHLPSK